MTRPRYEVLSHTADAAIAAYGGTLAELFENAAYGMFDLMFDCDTVSTLQTCSITAAGEGPEELLVNWLAETLTEAEIRDLAFSSFTVDRLWDGGIRGRAGGAPAAGFELRGPPVKAVTYHGLAVVQIPDGFRARLVFDV